VDSSLAREKEGEGIGNVMCPGIYFDWFMGRGSVLLPQKSFRIFLQKNGHGAFSVIRTWVNRFHPLPLPFLGGKNGL
jgi:hypothetical protein